MAARRCDRPKLPARHRRSQPWMAPLHCVLTHAGDGERRAPPSRTCSATIGFLTKPLMITIACAVLDLSGFIGAGDLVSGDQAIPPRTRSPAIAVPFAAVPPMERGASRADRILHHLRTGLVAGKPRCRLGYWSGTSDPDAWISVEPRGRAWPTGRHRADAGDVMIWITDRVLSKRMGNRSREENASSDQNWTPCLKPLARR